MINNYFLIILSCFLTFIISLNAQDQGEQLFSQQCAMCHTVGRGKLVGPDLANVQNRRTEEWILKFVDSPQSVIKSGDSTANALFNQYKIVMPDHQLTTNEIKSIIAYIKANSSLSNTPNEKTSSHTFNASLVTDLNIEKGRNIFEGETRLTNKGPACISCHNIANPTVFNGGLLAKDLTTVFSRLGPAGIKGILRNPPFPAMVNAFGSAPLTNEEINDLLSFFYYTNSKGTLQATPFQTQFDLLIGVIVGLIAMLNVFLIMWQRVKKHTVNFR